MNILFVTMIMKLTYTAHSMDNGNSSLDIYFVLMTGCYI